MPKPFPAERSGFHPFGDLIGLEFIACVEGNSRCRLTVRPELLNPHGVLHGGVVYSMVDTGMGGALYTRLDSDELCATIEIKINYFSAIRSGELICDTQLIHRGKRTAALDSSVRQGDQWVARALGTYSIFPVRKEP